MNLPMREKYVDEVVGVWFIFGNSAGGVDVNDGNRDVFQGIPLDAAQKIVDAQAKFREELYKVLTK